MLIGTLYGYSIKVIIIKFQMKEAYPATINERNFFFSSQPKNACEVMVKQTSCHRPCEIGRQHHAFI